MALYTQPTRVDLAPDWRDSKDLAFVYCPSCNNEIVGKLAGQQTCPICECEIIKKDGFFFVPPSYPYDYSICPYDWRKERGLYLDERNIDNPRVIELYRGEYNNLPSEQRYLVVRIAPPIGEIGSTGLSTEYVSAVFRYLNYARIKTRDMDAQNRMKQLLSECETESATIDDKKPVNAESIKNDFQNLKDYILYLIKMESGIYSVKERLSQLLNDKVYAEEWVKRYKYESTEVLRNNIKEAKEKLTKLDNKQSPFSNNTLLPYLKNPPKRPTEPKKPALKEASFLNRKKIQAENEALLNQYEKEKNEYEKQLISYDEAMDLFEYEKNKFYEDQKVYLAKKMKSWEEEIATAKAEAKQELEQAQAELTKAKESTSEFNSPAAIRKQMIDEEINQGKETLTKLIATRNELYDIGIIFKKYRDIIALSSFYEYLESGRCYTLEGPDGAYNIYESEIRANQVIAQLSDVIDSLEEIKTNQFMAYRQLQEMNSGLERLSNSMEDANEALEKIGKAATQTKNYMQRVAENSDIIAYHSERIAFYAKKNKELTDALGFMVALK